MKLHRRSLPALFLAVPALAQGTWPDRPIRLVAPYPPGGQTDVVARWIAEQLRPVLPQPIIVENRAGAQGIIGTQAVLAAPADGYSVLYVNASTTLINPVIHPGPPYDTFRDMAPVVQFGTAALVLTVRPDRGINSLAELIALAKRRPGELSYASFGIGSASHLYGAMLEKAAGVQMSHVPYRGSAAAVQDVLAGHAFMSINDEAVSVSQVVDGRLKALAVTGTQRIAAMPDVPTFQELGFAGGLEILGFNGLVMRAGTPPAIIQRFAEAVLGAVRTPQGRERLAVMGLLATGLGPEEFANQMRRDAPIWAQAARDSGARVE
ncbi:MAG: tripartite tricarboxylate transporter substrate binding protein [Roseococcus sp.]